MRAEYLSIGGSRVRCLRTGSGPPFVVVASPLILGTLYRPTAAALRPFHEVVIVELPGTGRSRRLRRPWTTSQYASFLADLLVSVASRPVTLLGHSNSGPIVAAAAVARPELVAELVLADVVGADPSRSLARVLAMRARDALSELRLTLAAAHQPLFNAVVHTKSLLAQIGFAAGADVEAHARAVRVPTRLLWGANDRTMPLSDLRKLAAWIPHARVYVHPRGSHDWIVDHAADVPAALELADVRACQAPFAGARA